MTGRLAGKRIMVTGAAQGIGAALARAFHREGARLLLVDRDAALLEKTVAELEAAGATLVSTVADITDARRSPPRSIRRAVPSGASMRS